MELRPIGFVNPRLRSLSTKIGEGSSPGFYLTEPWGRGLKGLEEFSHLVIVFHLHRAAHDPKTDLVRRPRGRADMPEVGIFAQRAKHRPNPIGITAVRLLEIQGSTLIVQGPRCHRRHPGTGHQALCSGIRPGLQAEGSEVDEGTAEGIFLGQS